MVNLDRDLQDDGERLLPYARYGELVHAEHLARYRFAAQFVAGLKVLDAASGEGYGTALLAQSGAREVSGVDLSGCAVEHAVQRYSLDYRVGDVTDLPFADDEFDLVVSFETIEHVDNPEKVVTEFRRVLNENGVLIISTPNKSEYLVENEFHKREFTHEEFVGLLSATFPTVELFYQQNWLTSTVLDCQQAAVQDGLPLTDLTLGKVAGIEPGRQLYTVAVCGNSSDLLERTKPVGTAIAAAAYEGQELARRLVEAERTVAEWHTNWEEAKQVAEQWHDRHIELHRAVTSSLSWRVTRPLRDARGVVRRLRRK